MFSLVPQISARFRLKALSKEEFQALRSDPSPDLIRKIGIPFWKLPLIAWHVRRLAREQSDGLSLFPGVAELLSRLHTTGVQVAIVSSNGEAAIAQVLGPILAAKVSFYECSASILGKRRPLLRVLRRAGVASSEAIYIGDETRDADAASAAGIDFGAVGWGYSTQRAFERTSVRHFFSTLQELEAVLLSVKE